MSDVHAEARTVPHSIDAEQWVLGAILIDNDGYALASTIVESGDFFSWSHQRVWDAIGTRITAGEPADLATVCELLKSRGQLDEVGPAYLSSLVDGVPHAANVEHYAKTVRGYAERREVIAAAEDVQQAAYSTDQNPPEIVSAFVDRLARVGQRPSVRSQEWRVTEETARECARRGLSDGAVGTPNRFSKSCHRKARLRT